MRKYIIWAVFLFLLLGAIIFPHKVSADVCYEQRVINMYACNPETEQGDVCAGTNTLCDPYAEVPCDPYAECKYGTYFVGYGCSVTDHQLVNCSSEAQGCKWTGVAKCKWDGASCNPNDTVTLIYGCWGPGEGTYMGCNNDNQCVEKSGDQANDCSSNADCEEPPPDPLSHLECNWVNCTCEETEGGGEDLCGVDSDCWTEYDVSGTVYLDNTEPYDDTTVFVANAGDIEVDGSLYAVDGNGEFSIGSVPTNPCDPSSVVLSLQLSDPQYSCAEPGDCDVSVVVDGDETQDFFVTNQGEAWWQTVGGDVGSNLGSVVSDIPSTCIEPICYPYLSRFSGGFNDTSGVITFWLGNYNFGQGTASEGENYVAEAKIPTNRGIEGYDFFYRQFEMGIEPEDDFGVAGQGKTGVNKPAEGSETNGRAFFSDGNLELNGNAWDLVPGEVVIVFVDGDLDVETQITTFPGEFLAFVVRGDITFKTGVADPTSEASQVEGVFIADGSINVNSGSDKFVGEGIFIGWGGVVLSRDFGGVDNNTNPTELFIYRPDFVSNAPDAMRRPVMRWNEVAP